MRTYAGKQTELINRICYLMPLHPLGQVLLACSLNLIIATQLRTH